MPRALDTFVLSMPGAGGGIDAEIMIPGNFPLELEPGADYLIGFSYVTGEEPATGFDIEWDTATTPTATITPNAPEGSGGQIRSATVAGTLPLVRDITYTATVWIRQA